MPKPGAREAIFVIHDGLMHEIGETPLSFRPAAKKDEMPAPADRQRRVGRSDGNQEPVTLAGAARLNRVDDVEGGEIDDAGMHAGHRAGRLVLLDDASPGERDNELTAAIAHLRAAGIRHLRLFDLKRRSLSDLPANQLVQVVGARGHLLELHERNLGDGIGHHESDTRRTSAHLVEYTSDGSDEDIPARDVTGRQRRHDGSRRQRRDRMGLHHRTATVLAQPDGRHPMRGDLDRRVQAGHVEKTTLGHSTNVTLLISLSVVSPVSTRSTAHSRRNRMPSSRAAFLISDVGRRARIISRM